MNHTFPALRSLLLKRSRRAGLVALASALAACTQDVGAPVTTVRPVKLLEITANAQEREQEYPGVVRATRSAAVGFEVPGRIVSLDAKEGQRVAPGEALAAIDDRDYVADLDVALANLRHAQADLGRSEGVYATDPGAITLQRIDSDRRAVDVTEARVAQARKAVDETTLRAPFSGVVSRRLAEVYENVLAKQPVVVVENLQGLEVEVHVPERDVVSQMREAVDAEEASTNLPTDFMPTVRISALPGREFAGRVVEVATQADAATRTFAIRVAFDVPANTVVLPGMTARVSVRFDSGRGIRIPITALVASPSSEAKVWVIDPTEMTASGRIVELGEVEDGYVEVVSGLEPGDLVATSGASELAEGMHVSRFEG